MVQNKQCPKCGTMVNTGGKFCKSCGASLSGVTAIDHRDILNIANETIGKAGTVLDKASQTAAQIESTITKVAKIGSTAQQVSQVVVRPPAEWKVVVGDMIPAVGQNIGETVVRTAEQKIQQKITEEVSNILDERLNLSKDAVKKGIPPVPESLVSTASSRGMSQNMICPVCNSSIVAGVRFCKHCGSPLSKKNQNDAKDQDTSKPPVSKLCKSCNSPLTPGAKFCKSCGDKV